MRSTVSHKIDSNSFLAQALQMPYMQNRLPSIAIPIKIAPYHLCVKSIRDLGPLRVFGSNCLYILLKQIIHKLDAHAKEVMFLEYAQNTKVYNLWDGD